MPKKSVKGVLASLILLLIVGLTPTLSAKAAPQNAPQLEYTDASGLNLSVNRKSISTLANPKFQWLVGGKVIGGATKSSFKASVKQRNQSIQLKVVAGSTTLTSVVGSIGQVIVNVKPTVEFTDESRTKVTVKAGAVSPAAAKVVYQWYKGPIDIPNAKSATYAPATSDQGFKIYVNARYTAKGFKEAAADSDLIDIPVIKRNYVQVWQEEFNLPAGSSPSSAIWSSENGDGSKAAAGGGWGNRERQYYIPELATITAEGALKITATKDGAAGYTCYYKGPCEWVSSKYITKDKLGFKYGRMEARIKGPVGVGTWGAFWMLGADIDERRWPWCGEIDVTELIGKEPNTNYGYLHGLLSGGFGGRGTTVTMPKGFAEEYHTYAIDWLPDQIDWYLDGVLFGSQPKVDKDWVFDHEFYLVMNLAMGGNLGGPIDPALQNSSMSFDWIRFSTINGLGEVIKH